MIEAPVIRPFEEADTESVIALWQACDLVVAWNDPHKDIARKLEVQRELFLVAELGGAIVGSVMAGYEGHRGWINYLAVGPDHQRKGYAQQLMHAAEEKLLALGCPKINLQVRATNEDVLAFYEHIGYTRDAAVSLGKRLIPDD